MSIDYSDMAFPKPTKKKKRKKHKKSILKSEKGVCFLCEKLYGETRLQYTEEHHVVFGSGRRSMSEAEGFKVDLCMKHHGTGKEGVHGSRKMRELLCRLVQEEYEKTHTREEFMKIAGRNYLG